MEHWIEITPDEVESGPFVIYSPRNSDPPAAPLPTPTLPDAPNPPAAGIFATETHYGNQTVCVYRNQSREKPSARVMMRPNLFVTFD